jgi:NAD(P)H-flavin reductase
VTALALAEPWAPVPAPVVGITRETPDVVTLRLRVGPGPRAFRPGQFLMVYAFGVGEAPLSIDGGEGADLLRLTVRAVGPVTAALSAAKRGDEVGIRGPFGRGWPLEEAAGRDLVLVSGGLGLPPLRAVLDAALADRARYGRLILLHGARTPEDLIYRRYLARLSPPDVEVRLAVDRADATWPGVVGVVPALLGRVGLAPERTVALACGPEVMLRFTARELQRLGVPADRIHVSLERNMSCGIGLCGRCQLLPHFVCKDGPVFQLDRIAHALWQREV